MTPAGPGLSRVTPLSTGRFAVDIGPDDDPLRLARELTAAGGQLVSITQIHDTLEDLFVSKVDQAAGTDRFGAREERRAEKTA